MRNSGVGLETSLCQRRPAFVHAMWRAPPAPVFCQKCRHGCCGVIRRCGFAEPATTTNGGGACNSCSHATPLRASLPTSRLLRLFLLQPQAHAREVESEPLDFDYVQNGKLVYYMDESLVSRRGNHDGVSIVAVAVNSRRSIATPACARTCAYRGCTRDRGLAFIHRSEDAGDCYRFCTSLEHIMRGGEQSGAIRTGTHKSRDLCVTPNRISAVRTNSAR
jgi:hypothetical protein